MTLGDLRTIMSQHDFYRMKFLDIETHKPYKITQIDEHSIVKQLSFVAYNPTVFIQKI